MASPVDDVVAAEPLPPPRVPPPRSPGGAALLPVAPSATAETSASLADRRRSSGEPRALLSMLGADAHAPWLRRRPIRGAAAKVSLGGRRWKSQASPGEPSRLSSSREWAVATEAEKKKKSPHLIGFSREGRFYCRASECVVTAETGVEENGGAAFLLHLRTGRPFTSPQPRASQRDPSQGSPKNAHSKSLTR